MLSGLLVTLLAGLVAGALAASPVVVLLALVNGAWGPLHRLDLGSVQALHEVALRHPRLVDALDVVAVVFAPATFQVLVGVAVALLLRARRYQLAAWAAVTMYGGAALSPAVKGLVERARPAFPSPVATANGYAFPSGHALDSLLGCAVLLVIVLPRLRTRRARRAVMLVAAGIVLLTGVDRVALGVHYVSDVLAGWLIAVAVLAGTSTALTWWRRQHGPTGPAEAAETAGAEPPQIRPSRNPATHAAASRKSRSDAPGRTAASSPP